MTLRLPGRGLHSRIFEDDDDGRGKRFVASYGRGQSPQVDNCELMMIMV